MPPVIPRFQFYLQLSLKPLVAYLKQLKDSQSVPDLRQEMLNMVQSANGKVDQCEERIMEHIKKLGERCDGLQDQIKNIESEKSR